MTVANRKSEIMPIIGMSTSKLPLPLNTIVHIVAGRNMLLFLITIANMIADSPPLMLFIAQTI